MSGQIIIIFSRSKRVNKNIICLCTRSDGNLLTCKISSSLELPLVRFVFSKEEEDEEAGAGYKTMATKAEMDLQFCMEIFFPRKYTE